MEDCVKYSELIEGWNKSNREWKEYHVQCALVASKIYATLKTSLDISDKQVFKLIDPDVQNIQQIKGSDYTPIDATKLIESGWAKFGLYFILHEVQNAWPRNEFRFTSFVKTDHQSIRFKLTKDDDEIKLSLDYDSKDEEEIINRFETAMRYNVHDSFKHWHDL